MDGLLQLLQKIPEENLVDRKTERSLECFSLFLSSLLRRLVFMDIVPRETLGPVKSEQTAMAWYRRGQGQFLLIDLF